MKFDRSLMNATATPDDVALQIEAIAEALASLRSQPLSNRHRAAVAALAGAQTARDAARARIRDLLAQRRAQRPGEASPVVDADLVVASQEQDAAAAAVREARIERDAAVAGCAPGVISRITPTLATAESLVTELLDTLEQLADPLATAERFLQDNRIDPPRILRRAPELLAMVREARRQLRGG